MTTDGDPWPRMYLPPPVSLPPHTTGHPTNGRKRLPEDHEQNKQSRQVSLDRLGLRYRAKDPITVARGLRKQCRRGGTSTGLTWRNGRSEQSQAAARLSSSGHPSGTGERAAAGLRIPPAALTILPRLRAQARVSQAQSPPRPGCEPVPGLLGRRFDPGAHQQTVPLQRGGAHNRWQPRNQKQSPL